MRQITAVTACSGPMIGGVVRLGANHWVYPQHFPGDPIFPGTLMIEAAGQLVALWAWAQGLRGRPRLLRTAASFHHPVTRDTEQLDLEAEVRAKRNMQFGNVSVRAGGLDVARVEVVLTVLDASVTTPPAPRPADQARRDAPPRRSASPLL